MLKHPYIFQSLSIDIFRDYQYLKTHTALLYSLPVVNGNNMYYVNMPLTRQCRVSCWNYVNIIMNYNTRQLTESVTSKHIDIVKCVDAEDLSNSLTLWFWHTFNTTLHTDISLFVLYTFLQFTIDKLCNDAVYVRKYWYSLAMANNRGRNM
jgi:hypothetical protein